MELDTKTHYPLITVRMRPPTDWEDLYRETDLALQILVSRLNDDSEDVRSCRR